MDGKTDDFFSKEECTLHQLPQSLPVCMINYSKSRFGQLGLAKSTDFFLIPEVRWDGNATEKPLVCF